MKIREIRRQLGLSQAEFARILGVHQTAVSQWETGRTAPEMQMAQRLARLSGRSVEEILGLTPRAAGEREGIEVRMPDAGMKGARIEEGDAVYVCADAPESGDIAAVETACGVLIRYYYCMNGETVLVSASREFPPVLLARGDKVLGKAYAFRALL